MWRSKCSPPSKLFASAALFAALRAALAEAFARLACHLPLSFNSFYAGHMSGRSSPTQSGRSSPCNSPKLPVVRVCGVPEHFNLPWTLGVKKKIFDGLADVRWCAVPGGTGAMVSAVQEGQQDVALALTEGIVAATLASNAGPEPLRYVGTYVTSALCWIVVCANGREDAPASLRELGKRASEGECIRVSVSRLGSGSHIMAYLLAMREGWPLQNLVFVKNDNFRSMRKGGCLAPSLTPCFCEGTVLRGRKQVPPPNLNCSSFFSLQVVRL